MRGDAPGAGAETGGLRELLLWVSGLWYVLFPVSGWILTGMKQWQIGGPICHWKGATGFPCFGCGTGRSAMALVSGEWPGAFTLQPLMMGLWLGAMGFLLFLPWMNRMTKLRLHGGRVAAGVAILVMLNWTWLIVDGR